MPRIVPIKEMKNTSAMSELVHSTDEPVYITKNGYGDMVIMSMETFEARERMYAIYRDIEISEKQFAEGEGMNAFDALAETRAKYGL